MHKHAICNSVAFVGFLLVVGTSSVHGRIPWGKLGSFCNNDTSRGDPNLIPIEQGPPRLIRTIENGALYQVGAGEDQSWLVHVWGMTGYDYGVAYGTLLSEQVQKFMPQVYQYLEQQIIDNLEQLKLPKWLKEVVVDKGMTFALDALNALAEPHMEKEIYQELRGIADATKVDYKLLVRLHLFGELTRGKQVFDASASIRFVRVQLSAHCSDFGARRHWVARRSRCALWTGTPMAVCKTFR